MLNGTSISLPTSKTPEVIEEGVKRLSESDVAGICSAKVLVGHDCKVIHKSSQWLCVHAKTYTRSRQQKS